MAVTSFSRQEYDNIKKNVGTTEAENYKKRYITNTQKYDYIAKYDQAEADKLIDKTYDDGKSSVNVPSTTKNVTSSGTPSKSSGTGANTASKTPTNTTANTNTTPNFVPTAEVNAAYDYLQSVLNNKPLFSSQYASDLDAMIEKINSRDKFSYDLNEDMLYQQAKDQYSALGKMAMQDTMGQAAAMTGGYGNSYASKAGNQAYQAYLQQLNNNIPEYYQMALNQYNQEGDNLLNQYSLMKDRYADEYNQYRDSVADWNTAVSNAYNQYNDERNLAYDQYINNMNMAYQKDRDAVSDAQWNQQMAYQKDRDAVSDAQWQKEFDANSDATYSNIYNSILDKYGITEGKLTNSDKINNLTDDQIERLDALAVNSDYEAIEKWLTKWMQDGTISEDMALYWMEYYYKVPDNPLMAYNDSITKG